MKVSLCTKDGLDFKAHATRRDAVAYLLDRLGPDHTSGPKAKFWASKDGEQVLDDGRMHDFHVEIYDHHAGMVRHICSYPDVHVALRLLADAIEAGFNEGLE